jgi:hypothetical protein
MQPWKIAAGDSERPPRSGTNKRASHNASPVAASKAPGLETSSRVNSHHCPLAILPTDRPKATGSHRFAGSTSTSPSAICLIGQTQREDTDWQVSNERLCGVAAATGTHIIQCPPPHHPCFDTTPSTSSCPSPRPRLVRADDCGLRKSPSLRPVYVHSTLPRQRATACRVANYPSLFWEPAGILTPHCWFPCSQSTSSLGTAGSRSDRPRSTVILASPYCELISYLFVFSETENSEESAGELPRPPLSHRKRS